MGVANACTLLQMDCTQRRAHAFRNMIEITHWAKWPNGARNLHPRAIYATDSQLDHEHVSGSDVGIHLGILMSFDVASSGRKSQG